MNVSKELSQYWILQSVILLILSGYIVGMGTGILLFLNSTQTTAETVNILMIIESRHPDYTFNYTYDSKIPKNRTLLDHLNETIGRENWEGEYYGIGGWFIQRIFNASEQGLWHWIIYYRTPGTSKWDLSPVGASIFKLNQDYEIKFLFSE